MRGQQSPLFIPFPMGVEEKIREIAEGLLKNTSHFIVDLEISTGGRGRKIKVLLDGDEGVTIDDCAEMSRGLGLEIEENGFIEESYTLEVSSPGLDHPLTTVRQYRKNIGRMLKVTLNEGKDIRGVLTAVADEEIQLEYKKGKGKKAEIVKVGIPFSEIQKSLVQISFK